MYPNDPPVPPDRPSTAPPRPGSTQTQASCPYCRRPLTTRADLSFTCARCGDFPNYGRMYTAPGR
jgi:hypothetical protein